MKAWQYSLVGAAAGAACAAYALCRCATTPEPAIQMHEIERIVERHDTIVVREPSLMVVLRRDTVTDTLRIVTDSVNGLVDSVHSAAVAIPVEQRCYSGDGYRAWVSGYRPTLDSIAMVHTTTQTTVVPPRCRRPRWSVGVSAGLGATPAGFEPYIGIGISYSIFSF